MESNKQPTQAKRMFLGKQNIRKTQSGKYPKKVSVGLHHSSGTEI